MMASYKAIDYRIRPAKYAERLMIAEVAGRLRFHDVWTYRYVGLGSIYFTDFKLMHRALGISSMVSIEAETCDRERFDWNRPYATIDMHYGSTDAILPNLDWTPPSIVWLDYDGQISRSKLLDIEFLVRHAAPGSLLVFSLNCETPSPTGYEPGSDFVDALRAMVGVEVVDPSLKHEDLQGWSAAKVYRRIIASAIEGALASFNSLEASPQLFRRWRQVLNIEYKDGARMLTVGGIVYEARQEELYRSGAFEKLIFYRDAKDPYRIEVPRLTLKEMAHLENVVMHPPEEVLNPSWLTAKERRYYIQLYRYLANFVPVEM